MNTLHPIGCYRLSIGRVKLHALNFKWMMMMKNQQAHTCMSVSMPLCGLEDGCFRVKMKNILDESHVKDVRPFERFRAAQCIKNSQCHLTNCFRLN